MMSSKGQVYVRKTVDFISKTEGSVYFEQVGTLYACVSVGVFACHKYNRQS